MVAILLTAVVVGAITGWVNLKWYQWVVGCYAIFIIGLPIALYYKKE